MVRLNVIYLLDWVLVKQDALQILMFSSPGEESDQLQPSEQSQDNGLRLVREAERSAREAITPQERKRRRQLRRRKSRKSKNKKKTAQPNTDEKPGKRQGGRKSSPGSKKQQSNKWPKNNNNNGNNIDVEKQGKSFVKQTESKPITKECLTNILTAMKLRTKGTNYKKQHDRISKFEKTGKNKLSKKAQFSSVAEKLVDIGGGNKDELKCGSEGSSGAGAESLKEAITELDSCEEELKTKCNTSSYSIPPDTAEVSGGLLD